MKFFCDGLRLLDSTRASLLLPHCTTSHCHANNDILSADHNYDWHGNRSRTGSINVAWQLMDVDETDGGFVYIPGGHKASLPLPTEHYSPRDGGGHAYAVGDDHDPDGLFGVVRPLLKAGVRSSPFPFPFPLLSSSLPFPPLNQSQYRSAFVALSHASASITFLLAVHATCLHANLLMNANMWARRIVSSLWVVRARTVRCHTQRMPTIHAVRC